MANMSTAAEISGASRLVIRLNETSPVEAAELFQELASAPPAPETATLDYLLDAVVEPPSGD